MEFSDKNRSLIFIDDDRPKKFVRNEKWDESILAWADEKLPHVDITFPACCTLEGYLSQHTKNFKKVAGMFPEIYICDGTDEHAVRSCAGQMDAYFCVQMVPTENGSIAR
ncbi:unnamed protein product [Gongylonema pulchrum]|uniref:SH3 domain-containing protein n=1 Tax=Gongylonema pulchrum TaxID=637853 RepID=A0A183DMD3_9BILA|nr:unnamed protein product [Gongylonema pulchrum]